MKYRHTIGALIGAVLWTSSTDAKVVGFPEPYQDAYVAIRGYVAKGTTIKGITFYSNDSSVFPEIVLTMDSGPARLPEPGVALRSVSSVIANNGYVTVSFPDYIVPAHQYIWAIVRFPEKAIKRAGLGPGIGLRKSSHGLWNERSFYTAGTARGEYDLQHFDISLVTTSASKMGISAAGEEQSSLERFGVYTQALRGEPGIALLAHLPRQEQISVEVFDVAGRRVARIANEVLPRGDHQFIWRGRDSRGRTVSSGLYLYKIQYGHEQVSGKMILVK